MASVVGTTTDLMLENPISADWRDGGYIGSWEDLLDRAISTSSKGAAVVVPRTLNRERGERGRFVAAKRRKEGLGTAYLDVDGDWIEL